MNRSPLQIDFEQLWKQGMYDWHGKMPERMINDELEEAFWTESIKKKTYRQTDAHAKPIYEKIRKHIPENATCLEIGPGWGNYTPPRLYGTSRSNRGMSAAARPFPFRGIG